MSASSPLLPPLTQEPKHVALCFNPGSASLWIDVLSGIGEFAQDFGAWRFWFPDGLPPAQWRTRYGCASDAVIFMEGGGEPEGLADLRIPAVGVSNRSLRRAFPRVVTDDRQVGVMAAEYFLGKGYSHFAFIGVRRAHYATERQKGFAERLGEAGFRPPDWPDDELFGSAWRTKPQPVEQWLKRLPLPIAVLAANDSRAAAVINAALLFGFKIPEEICVVGVDNDPIQNALSALPLSSVRLAGAKIGYEAMRLISEHLHTPRRRRLEKSPPLVLVPPIGIITRRSSDVAAVKDEAIAGVLRHIAEHLAAPLYVEELCRKAGLSRRAFERRFKKTTGQLPYHFIMDQRMRWARQLLSNTDLTVTEVAARCGSAELKHFTTTFTRWHGESPKAFRGGGGKAGSN